MRFRLRPVETKFFDLFVELAGHLVVGADLLGEVLEDDADFAAIAKRVHEVESLGDDVTHEIVRLVGRSFLTPFDREDIYVLADELDNVLDHLESAVDAISLFGVESFPDGFADQVAVLQRGAHVTSEAMRSLHSPRSLKSYWMDIGRLENEADQHHREVLAVLFSGEYKAIQVLKLKDVVNSVEQSINSLEAAAKVVEQIAVKES